MLFKIFTVKQEKHDAIKLLAQSKLGSIADIISQAMQTGDISSIEFHKVLQEVEKYRKLKADIRSQAKTKVRQITKEQLLALASQTNQGHTAMSMASCILLRYTSPVS